MPYKANGSDVPPNIAKLSAPKRRQWAVVWNSAFQRCIKGNGKKADCEESAFKQASGVVKEEENMMGYTAQRPVFDGIEEVPISAEGLTFERFLEEYYEHTGAPRPTKKIVTYENSSKAVREWIAKHALLVNLEAETFEEAYRLFVVNPATACLNAPEFMETPARLTDVEGLAPAERDAVEITMADLLTLVETPLEVAEAEEETAEIDGTVGDYLKRIRLGFIEQFAPETKWRGQIAPTLWIRDFLYEDDRVGNMLIVLDESCGKLKGVTYEERGGGFLFSPRDQWKEVVKRWEVVGGMTASEPETDSEPETEAESFAEVDAPIIRLMEAEAPQNRRAPLALEVALIQVGPGNKRDKHYYTREMLERDGHVFEGVTMHTVDHREDQRSEITDVSTVKKVTGVTEIDGGLFLVAEVLAYDPAFCEKTRNRAAAGLLDKLQCSILAMGEAETAQIDGVAYNVVQRITEARHVDWVTRAGAGGHALTLAETETDDDVSGDDGEKVAFTKEGEEEHTTVVLSEEEQETGSTVSLDAMDVINVIEREAPHLQATSLSALLSRQYANEEEVREALAEQIHELKISGSGAPLSMGQVNHERRRVSQAEIDAQLDEVNEKHLGG